MTTAIAAQPSMAELHQASIVNIFGYEVNVYATVIIILAFIFLIALRSAHKAQRLDWLDMITRDGTKVSTTKLLQLVGGVVGTFIIIKVTLQGTLTWDLFAIYLSYVASIDGFSKLIMAKYGASGSDDSKVPYPRKRDDEGKKDDCTPDTSQTVNITVAKTPEVVTPPTPPVIPPAVLPTVTQVVHPNPLGGGAKAGMDMPD